MKLFGCTYCVVRPSDIQYNDTQHNDTQHNDTQHNGNQHKGLICDTQHKRHSARMKFCIECRDAECGNLFIIMLNVIIPSVINYAECHYAECRGAL